MNSTKKSYLKWWWKKCSRILFNDVIVWPRKEFKYLDQIINNDLSDNCDVKWEIRNLFMRTNVLIRRHSNCSHSVKLTLFKAYCMCLYGAGIWRLYSATVWNKLRSCYNKCIKMFFGYDSRSSVTDMLSEVNLPCFEIFISECVHSVNSRWLTSCNNLVANLVSLQL